MTAMTTLLLLMRTMAAWRGSIVRATRRSPTPSSDEECTGITEYSLQVAFALHYGSAWLQWRRMSSRPIRCVAVQIIGLVTITCRNRATPTTPLASHQLCRSCC